MADIFDYYPENDLFKTYLTRSFADIFPSVEDFLTEYKAAAVPTTITDGNAQTLYYLLYSKYGNSHIANSDENQFKYKIWSTIFMYGPTWEKRLEIQNKLRNLSDDGLQIVVVNYESAWRMEKDIISWGPDLVIADEAHKMKEARTVDCKSKIQKVAAPFCR